MFVLYLLFFNGSAVLTNCLAIDVLEFLRALASTALIQEVTARVSYREAIPTTRRVSSLSTDQLKT